MKFGWLRTALLASIVLGAGMRCMVAVEGHENAAVTKDAARVPVQIGATPPATAPKPVHAGKTPVKPMSQTELDAHLLPKNKPADLASVFSFVYNGYRRSQIEPCGCVSHQLGGLDKEARLVQRLRDMDIPVVQADAGGFVKDMPNTQMLVQTHHVLAALMEMKVDVVNIGAPDAATGLKWLKDAQTSYSVPFVSASVVDETSTPVFAPYKVVPVKLKSGGEVKIGFVGVTRPRTVQLKDKLMYMDPVEAATKYVPMARKEADLVVLLTYDTRDGATDMAHKLGKEALPDLIVAGEFVAQSGMVADVNGTRIVSGGFEGRQVGHMMVDWKDKKLEAPANHMIEILQSIPPLETVTKHLDASKAEIAKLPRESTAPGSFVAGKSTYATAMQCKMCHQKEYDQWAASKHGTAMTTLVKKNQQYNTNCLRCHVTGYKVDNGFTDYRNTPHMGNVQCDMCHGPGFQHVVTKQRERIAKQMNRPATSSTVTVAKLRTKFDEKFCSSCHDDANDNRFDYARDIKLVDHSKTAHRPAGVPVTRPSKAKAAREM